MKKREKRTIKKRYIILMITLVAVGALLALALYGYSVYGTENSQLVRSETVYIVVALLILLPILLCALIIAVLARRHSNVIETEELTIRPVIEFPAAAADEKADKKEEVVRPCRFDGLSRIDARKREYAKDGYREDITLKGVCESFRNFAAGKLGLYYDISDIRRFIAGMSVSQILILQGMSGTGKTSLAYAFGEFLGNPSTVIPVQPMWKERTDLIGYYNEFTKRFNETDLLKKMYEANYSRDIYVTVLDEMNIARVEYYFAEFLSLLELPEAEKRNLSVVSDEWDNDPEQLKDGHIRLPGNMWFIGTANNDDSTFAISDKVYDRAMIMDLDSKAEEFEAESEEGTRISAEKFKALGKEAMKEYRVSGRNRKRLEKLDEYMIEQYHITFGNRIKKQINEYIPIYVACGGEELDALDDILAKKVMRKLSMQNPVYIRNSAEKFCGYIEELFGEDKMPICKQVIRRIEKNA